MVEAALADVAIRELMYASFIFQNMSRWSDATGWPPQTPAERVLAAWTLRFASYARSCLPFGRG